MGQYSQWLYHRQIEQQLQERLNLLEQELHTLQEQAVLLEDANSTNDNPIVQAIAMQQSAEALFEDRNPLPSTEAFPSLSATGKEQTLKSVSPALFAWGHLPNLDTQKLQAAGTDHNKPQPVRIHMVSVPHPEVTLLPADMATFIDTHEQTMPQLRLPGWLRKAAPLKNTLIKQKSTPDERTNTSIQRWVERWGRQLPSTEQQMPEEEDHT